MQYLWDEDVVFQALVMCTKAHALLLAMRHILKLPEDDVFERSGSDWLILLYVNVDEYSLAKIMFIHHVVFVMIPYLARGRPLFQLT